jgi:hypothetical protein
MGALRRVVLAAAVALAAAAGAVGQLRNLEEGYPVMLEDAEPMEFGILQGQGFVRYSAFDLGTSEGRIEPGLLIGFARGWQASLAVPVIGGTSLQTSGGDLLASVLYNFLPEGEGYPGLALAGAVDMPSIFSLRNSDIRFKFIASKIVRAAVMGRLHLNVTYGILSSPGVNERYRRFIGSFGYSRNVGGDTILVADYTYEETRIAGITAGLLEAGLRRAFSPALTVSLGAGIGVGEQSLHYRVMAGVQVWVCDLFCPPRK